MNTPGYILLVKFRSPLSLEEARKVIDNRLPEFQALSGLQQKYYTYEPETGDYAGVYLWDSAEALDAFRASELRKTIALAYKTEGQPRVEVLQVIKPLRP